MITYFAKKNVLLKNSLVAMLMAAELCACGGKHDKQDDNPNDRVNPPQIDFGDGQDTPESANRHPVSKEIVSKQLFLKNCPNVEQIYSLDPNGRLIPFQFKNYIGDLQTSTARFSVKPVSPSCDEDQTEYGFKLKRVNDVSITTFVFFDVKDSGVQVSEYMSDCFSKFYPYIKDEMKKDNVVFSPQFAEGLNRSVMQEYCPAMVAGIVNDLVNLLKKDSSGGKPTAEMAK